MLPGSRNLSPVTISNSLSGQLQVSGCCDWLDKICEKFLSTSSNNNEHQNNYCDDDYGQHSSEYTLWKDSTADNPWRNGGGRFFACTGYVFVKAGCSSTVATVTNHSARRNEKHIGFECVGKQSRLFTGARDCNGFCRIDSTIPAAGSFLRGDHGDLACDTDASRSVLHYRSSVLGLSSYGKTSRLSENLNPSSRRKGQAGSYRSYETTVSCPTENFLSSSSTTFRTLNAPENSCGRSFRRDFKILDNASTWCHYEQKLFVSNDRSAPVAIEPINFDRQWLCMSILEQANRNPAVASICSKLARRGYLCRGRGSVALLFKTSEQAGQFIVPDFRVAFVSYVYLNDSHVNSEWPGKHRSKFACLCQLYNPECQYIFSVTVDAHEEVCCNPLYIQPEGLISQIDDDDLVSRFCAKLPVYILHSLNRSLDIDDPGATLVLTAVPGSELSENGDGRRAREICFINIQQKLRQRGVSLRHRFPEVYRRLCAYAEKNVEFMPISLFLTDSKTRKKFLCLIMPNSEPFCSWMEEESVGELGPETIV